VTLGRIHDSTGNHDLALDEFRHALSLNARDATAVAGMARAYENAGRIADAEAAYRKAADLEPNNWDGYNNLGSFLFRHGKNLEAVAQFEHALQLAPDNAEVLANIGAAYLNAGDQKSLQAAEAPLKRSVALNPAYAALANLGNLYYMEHRYSEAEDATARALRMNPSDYIVWDNLRLADEWLNDASGARSAAAGEEPLLLAYLKLHSQDASAQASYANLVARYGRRDQAEQHVRTALALSPADPDVLQAVSAAYEGLGDRKLAVKYLNDAFAHGYAWNDARNDPEAQALLKDPGVKAAKK